MARIRVRLKRIPRKKKRAIELTLTANFKIVDEVSGAVRYGQLKMLIPNERILPSNWDEDSERPTHTFSSKDRFRLFRLVEEHTEQLNKAYLKVKENDSTEKITPQTVRKEYLKLTGQDRSVQVVTRIPYFIDKYIETSRHEKELTKNQYGLIANRVRQFEVETKQACYWQTYSFDIHEQFLAWLEKRFELNGNSLWNYEKLILKFRSLARNQGLLKDSNHWRRVAKYEQTDSMYLDWSMIKKLMDFEPKSDGLRNTRNTLLVLLFTGLRISDLKSFISAYTDDVPFGWSMIQLTKAPCPTVCIPVCDVLRKVMKENPPVEIPLSTLHYQIKQLMTQVFDCDTAKQVSAHTCRSSFITNFLPHVPEGILRKITGHSLPSVAKVFHGYDRLSLKDSAVVFMRQIKSIPIEQTAGIRLTRFVEEISEN